MERSHSLVYMYVNTEIRCADLGRPWNKDDIVQRQIELEISFNEF